MSQRGRKSRGARQTTFEDIECWYLPSIDWPVVELALNAGPLTKEDRATLVRIGESYLSGEAGEHRIVPRSAIIERVAAISDAAKHLLALMREQAPISASDAEKPPQVRRQIQIRAETIELANLEIDLVLSRVSPITPKYEASETAVAHLVFAASNAHHHLIKMGDRGGFTANDAWRDSFVQPLAEFWGQRTGKAPTFRGDADSYKVMSPFPTFANVFQRQLPTRLHPTGEPKAYSENVRRALTKPRRAVGTIKGKTK